MSSRTRSGKVYRHELGVQRPIRKRNRQPSRENRETPVDLRYHQHIDPEHIMQFAFANDQNVYEAFVRLVSNPIVESLPGSDWHLCFSDLWSVKIKGVDLFAKAHSRMISAELKSCAIPSSCRTSRSHGSAGAKALLIILYLFI